MKYHKVGDLTDHKKFFEALKDYKIVDLRFIELPFLWQHFSIPANRLNKEDLEVGIGFDGSSIRGWQKIHQSDMIIKPKPETAYTDPFTKEPTLVVIADVFDPETGQPYHKDPRGVTKRAQEYLKKSGIGDTAFFGPEAEFYIFDGVQFDSNGHESYFHIHSEEGRWESGEKEHNGHLNLGHRPRTKEGYFPVPPSDSLQDLRTTMMLNLEKIGIATETHHHEVGGPGQAEIDMRYLPLLDMADAIMTFKYVVKNTAANAGKTATFFPKPLVDDNGSGMHVHLSIWKNGKNTFAGDGYAGLSQEALWAIGGILKHAPALTALTNPTTVSYKRLVPGFEAPVNLAYSKRNRSAAIRIPIYAKEEKTKRIEFRCPDPTCNPYLAFSAMLMAAIDGIKRKIDPGKPYDMDTYDLPPEIAAKVPTTPATLDEALEALEKDHKFLLEGEVFSKDLLDTWLEIKRKEIQEINTKPHPVEFALYYDA